MPQVEWRGGTCRVKWWTGEHHENGRKRMESKGGFTDEDEAWDYGLDREHELRHGRLVTNRDGSTLMGQWCDDWLAALDHAYLTERNYRASVENHIKPFFRGRTVREIDILGYRAFRKQLHRVLRADSARNVLMVFGMLMGDAVEAGLRSASPVERKRRRGRYKRKPREKKRDMHIEAVYQLALNAKTFWGFPGYVFVLTMAATGMRPGELYALRREYCPPNWPASDPDPDGEHAEPHPERYAGADGMPAIRVQYQHQYEAGGLKLLPPKYESYRTLVVPRFLAILLKILLDSHDSEWVFPAISGGPLAATNFDYRYWRPIADGREAKESVRGPRARRTMPAIPGVATYKGKRLYLLRHGAKEWLDEDGHSRVAVEARQGHELPGVEGVYSNVTEAMERAIMGTLQARWVGLVQPLRLQKP